MHPGGRIDELPGNPKTVATTANAAFQDVADAELTSDAANIDSVAPVGEGRVAGDDEKPAATRQRGDDVLGHAVGEIVLFRIAAHIGEGKDCDGWSVRISHTGLCLVQNSIGASFGQSGGFFTDLSYEAKAL